MAQLRVVPPEFERLPILQVERHPPIRNPENLHRAAVDQPEPGVVEGPADAVARAQLDLLDAVDLAAAPARADLLRFPGHRGAVPTFEQDVADLVVYTGHTPFVALPDAHLLISVEH